MHSDTTRLGDGRAGADPIAAAVSAGEWVLARRFGSAITLTEPEDLAGSGPAVVVRVRVASSPFQLPRTLVIKHYADDSEAAFATEAAGYQLFTALTSKERMCPEPIGHDGEHRTLVLSDLGRAPTLDDKLQSADDRAAERALLSWARALGKMHATTARREADFNALLRRLGGSVKQTKCSKTGVELPPVLADILDVETPEAVSDEVSAAEVRVHGGAYRAFSPVDLSPENNLVTGNGVRFLDFEHGCVRNALIDVAHLRVPFAFWADSLALPAGMSDAMIAAWRAEIADVWPELQSDEVFVASLLESQLVCVWTQTLQELAGVTAERAAALRTWWSELAKQARLLGNERIGDHAEAVADAIDARFGPRLRLAVYRAFRE